MIRYLTDWLGDDALRVGNLTHRLLMEFRNDYLHFPKSISNKDKGRPFPEILEPYRDDQHETGFSDDYATISRTTVNKGLGLLQAIFAVVLGDAPINPARNLKVEVEQNFHPRRNFSTDELNQLFGAGPWGAGGGYGQRPSRYWLPLLGLWTGARLEELAQLMVRHVQKDGEICYLNITGGNSGTTVKNRSSIRKIPIHRMLVDLGFLEYVRKQGDEFIFNDLSANKFGRRSQSFSHWFARHLDEVGLTDPSLTYHSFRHGFITAATGVMDPDVRRRLAGHALKDEHGGYIEFKLGMLNREMAKLCYQGLDLGHLLRNA